MALQDLSIFETPRRALWWVRGRIYFDQLGRNLPLALALGGILQLCSRQYLLPESWSMLSIISWPFSVFGVPLITSLLMSNDMRVGEIRRLARRKAKIALFYFTYQARKSTKEIREYVNSLDRELQNFWVTCDRKRLIKILDKMEYCRCIAATIEYTHFLADALYDYFKFPSSDSFLGHMNINEGVLSRDIEILVSGIRRILSAKERGEANEQAVEEVQRTFLLVSRQLEEIEAVTDPDFVWEIVQITTIFGTSRAINTFMDYLYRLSRVKGEKVATRFAQVANDRRGFPLRVLADLADGVNQPIFSLPSYGRHRADAQKYVAENFRSFLEHLICLTGASKISISTIGFSSTVIACLKNSADLIDFVYVLQCDQRTILADRDMFDKVMSIGLRAELIDTTAPGCQASTNVSLVVFGFEVLSAEGEFLHKRGLEVIIRTVMTSLFTVYEQVVAVGETWKVRQFEPSFRSQRLTKATRNKAGLTVITDCGMHDIVSDDQLDFRCCIRHWEKTTHNHI
jgi:hypothetical protein